jgi:hypothetical protein
MRRVIFYWLFAIGCVTAVFAQQRPMNLDDAIYDSIEFFDEKLPGRSVIAITNFEAPSKELSDYIIEELAIAFANRGTVTVVERRRLEALEKELDFNMSGAVSDETAQAIGRMIGAQIVISGSIVPYRDIYRIRVQAFVVETAALIGARINNVNYDNVLTGYLGIIDPANLWKYKTFYAGVMAGYTGWEPLDAYWGYPYISERLKDGGAFGYGAFIQYQFVDLFALALEVGSGPNDVYIAVSPTLTMRFNQIEFDALFGLTYPIVPSGDAAYNNAISFWGGGRLGYHIGPGVAFVDVHVGNYPVAFSIFAGYQLGFINRKTK